MHYIFLCGLSCVFPRDLHVPTHFFPTRRSSNLRPARICCRSMFRAHPCCRGGIGPYLRRVGMASVFLSDSLAICQTAEEWTASDWCTDLLYQSSCRLQIGRAHV